MRILNLITAAVAVASFATAAAFAQTKPVTSPTPTSKMGRMSKSAASGKMKTGKMTRTAPMRDPKTGRFLSKEATSKMTAADKKGPVRDPKTGRFMSSKMKASPAPK